MSVVFSTDLSGGLYVPFRGVDRARSPVGTVSIRARATGDGSGGSVSAAVASASRILFGFHPMLALTRLHTFDRLATIVNVRLTLQEAGNERIDEDYADVVTPVEQATDNNVANMSFLGVPIEPDGGGGLVSAVWQTNTNALAYDLVAFFVVYDLEALARSPGLGAIDMLVSGIR